MKPVFQFREGCHLSGDAQKVGEHLEGIRSRAKNLTPDLVLEDARKAASPLHDYFEWDDAIAAEQHRIRQAGHIIRSVTVTYIETAPTAVKQITIEGVQPAVDQSTRPVRAFVAVTRDGERGYESTATAMNDSEMRRQVLQRAFSELDTVGRKYRELQELAEVFSALEHVAKTLREPIAAQAK